MKLPRTLAPTAAPFSINHLLASVRSLTGGCKYRDRVSREIKEYFGVNHVFLLSSGKAALTLVLTALKAKRPGSRVIIPAYTCFSVPSSIIKAGLDVTLCDINPETLDFNFIQLEKLLEEQHEHTLCVVSTHLFGHSSNVERVRTLCEKRNVVVLEDVAQAMGGRTKGALLGTLGDVAFFSLGRGKNITCGAGGIIITRTQWIAETIESEYAKIQEAPFADIVRNWLEMVAMHAFIHPWVYWVPAGIPFLGLGETRFYTDFPIHRMDEVRAAALCGWQDRLELSNRERSRQAQEFLSSLKNLSVHVQQINTAESVYLRLPLLVRDKKMKQAVCELGKDKGVGISSSYPTTIQEIRELQNRLPSARYPGAEAVVDRMVTIPTHHFVDQQDRRKMYEVLNLASSVEEGLGPTSESQGGTRISVRTCTH